jgi:S-adenosylmethionine:tRNA ribosyltransferase-isomerase
VRRADFAYDLPEELIAQSPLAERSASRLLVLEGSTGALSDRSIRDLPELVRPGDLLVFNNTRVLPARLLGNRARTGGKWEGLYLQTLPDGAWELLCQTRGRLEVGETIAVGELRLTLVGRRDGHWLARPESPGTALELLERYGQIPLPPYIRKGRAEAADRDRYQTVYAQPAGSVAAPTAGLHFTPELLARLDERGIRRAFVTLHVGIGTFQPIKSDTIDDHQMHHEWGELPMTTVEEIERCRTSGGRVVAVGTTTVRVLETVAALGPLAPWRGETNLFIRPPYSFRVVDALVTNFHLPRSTLLLLVGAFVGFDALLQAYRYAIENEYRFFSYGDAMLIY